MKLEVRIVGKRAAVGIDVAHLRVSLDDDGHLAWREQELHRVRLSHDARHARREAVGGLAVLGRRREERLAARLVRGGQRRTCGRRSSSGAATDLPDAGEIRQLGDRRPVGRHRRFGRDLLRQDDRAADRRQRGE